MHLHQPDWKSGEGTVDGGVEAGDRAHGAHAADGGRSWTVSTHRLGTKRLLPTDEPVCPPQWVGL